MRRRELERLLLKWQGIVGLLDWDVTLLMEADDSEPEAHATIEYDPNERTATLRMKPGAPDQERLIVHELMHLIIELAGISSTNEEQMVEAMSKALVGLKRGDV